MAENRSFDRAHGARNLIGQPRGWSGELQSGTNKDQTRLLHASRKRDVVLLSVTSPAADSFSKCFTVRLSRADVNLQ